MVDIYISTLFKNPCARGGWYMYMLTTTIKGKEYSMPGEPQWIPGTEYEAAATALADALDRMTKNSEIIVHTESSWLIAGMEDIAVRAGHKFCGTKGNPIKYADLWQRIYFHAASHTLTFEKNEKYTYAGELMAKKLSECEERRKK